MKAEYISQTCVEVAGSCLDQMYRIGVCACTYEYPGIFFWTFPRIIYSKKVFVVVVVVVVVVV